MAPEEEVDYNRLIQLHQQEKRGGAPVPLVADFHDRVRDFLERLRASYDQERARDPSSMRSLQLADQLQKARSLQMDIINLRMRKFLLLAHQTLTGARVDTRAFTPEEKTVFQELVDRLCAGRNWILEGGAAASSTAGAGGPSSPPAKCAPPDGFGPEPVKTVPVEPSPVPDRAGPPPSGAAVDSCELVVLRILEDVPDFAMGEGVVACLRRKDLVALQREMARALEQHGKARPVS
ncbi:MAG: DNA replication complex GINS family protein [Euryarchaeota archaeon]|nr:DNA replication complex GINS family protein [Euryarchaeota archaeon]